MAMAAGAMAPAWALPCERQFAGAPSRVDSDDTMERFARGVAVHLRRIAKNRKIPKGGLTLVITKGGSAKKPPAGPKECFMGPAASLPDIDIAEYGKRLGIETGHSMIEGARVRTRSKKMRARIFCLAFALLPYSARIMLNALLGGPRQNRYALWRNPDHVRGVPALHDAPRLKKASAARIKRQPACRRRGRWRKLDRACVTGRANRHCSGRASPAGRQSVHFHGVYCPYRALWRMIPSTKGSKSATFR